MFNYLTSLLFLSLVIFFILISFDLEFSNSSKISFGQNSNLTDSTNISSSINSSKNETQTTTTTAAAAAGAAGAEANDWLSYSNNKFELKYPPDWDVEKKLSKFHVLDFKLIKHNPFSFIGISFSSLPDSEKFTNEIILDEAEKFGMSPSSSGYEFYQVLEKEPNKYTIDANPSSFHIVKYKYEDNDLEGKLMEIFSLIDKRLFTLTYQSTIENFDKDLPVVEKIIESIKIIK
jgi:hypothetical protein